MFDIDAGHSHALRLNADFPEAVHPEQAVADAHREMTEATMRWIDARMRLEALRAQARPIPVSVPVLTGSNDFWDHRHRVMAGAAPKIAGTTGQIEFLHEDDGA